MALARRARRNGTLCDGSPLGRPQMGTASQGQSTTLADRADSGVIGHGILSFLFVADASVLGTCYTLICSDIFSISPFFILWESSIWIILSLCGDGDLCGPTGME